MNSQIYDSAENFGNGQEKEYIVTGWDSLVAWIGRLSAREGSLWYRGQPDYGQRLIPSIQRHTDGEPESEQYMATNFMIETLRLKMDTPDEYDRARWLSLMQHYGLPTRLLDWSESPLIALYFALCGTKYDDRDAALWCLNAMKLNDKMGEGKYLHPISYRTVRKYLEGAFNKKNNPSQNKIIACCGVGNDLRMYVQQSNFTVHDITDLSLDEVLAQDDFLYKLRIPARLKKDLFADLELFGINEKTVFPDMEHIAKKQREIFHK